MRWPGFGEIGVEYQGMRVHVPLDTASEPLDHRHAPAPRMLPANAAGEDSA